MIGVSPNSILINQIGRMEHFRIGENTNRCHIFSSEISEGRFFVSVEAISGKLFTSVF
jgi:hypothetical protein